MVTNISRITINATLNKVWDTLTKPELVKCWQYGSDLETNWKIGSPIRFRAEWEGKVFEQWGKVLEVRKNELIKYSLYAPRPGIKDKPENYFIMSYVLSFENGQTHLEILQEDPRPGAVQEEPQGEENPVLKQLKHVAETA